MQHFEAERGYHVRERPLLPRYRLWHTLLLVIVTGIAGWYAAYRAFAWLVDLLHH
jgi:hypothetical protein